MTKRRSYKRSRRGRPQMYRTPRFPPTQKAYWLTTSGFVSLDAGAGTIAGQQLFLNSVVDPLGSISGSQAAHGLNQLAVLYNRYCVLAWNVKFECASTDNTNPIIVGFAPGVTVADTSTYHAFAENRGNVHRLVTPDIDKVVFGHRGRCRPYLLPRGGKMLGDDTVCASTGGNPDRPLLGYMYAQAQDTGANPANIAVTITLKQLVVFFDPKSFARSTV